MKCRYYHTDLIGALRPNLSNPAHVDEIVAVLEDDKEDPSLNEDLGEESDIDSQDEVEQREGNSDTRQEDEETEDEYESYPESQFF